MCICLGSPQPLLSLAFPFRLSILSPGLRIRYFSISHLSKMLVAILLLVRGGMADTHFPFLELPLPFIS